LRPETAWEVGEVLSIVSVILCFIYASVCINDGDMLSGGMMLITGAAMASGAVIAHSARRLAVIAEEGAGEIECFRLKKAGLDISASDWVVPKGKMPKQ
jgi:hypothetical protein